MAGLFTSLLLHLGIARTSTKRLWMGATDVVKEGDFVWNDGTHLPLNASVWLPGNPSNSNNEDCLHIATGAGYRLNDIRCNYRMPFICQIDM